MSQLSAVDLVEQPLAPYTPVTTVRRDHLERSIYLSAFDRSYCGTTLFALAEFRYPQYVSTDTVRAGDVHRGPVRRVVRERHRRQRGANSGRVANA